MSVTQLAGSRAARPSLSWPRLSPLARAEARTGLLFLSPWILGFFLWILLPMLASLLFSFTSFNLVHPGQTRWVGLANYARLLRDPVVQQSTLVTLRFAAIAVPVGVLQPVAMAALLNARRLGARRLFTTLFYMPYIVPLVSAVYIWQGMLNARTGWVNLSLGALGLGAPDWLNSVSWIYPALVIIGLWSAGNAMLVTLAGMQTVPQELYDAARVDGAGPWTSFTRITLPLITPAIFYNLVLLLIGIFQYFLVPFVLTNGTGRPGNATLFYAMHLYKTAFTYSDMGYGATMAWALFLVVLGVTGFVFWSARYWVFYASETRQP